MKQTCQTKALATMTMALLATITGLARAETPTESNTSPIDQYYRGISTSLTASSRWFDNFFYNPDSEDAPRPTEDVAGTLLRLRSSFVYEEGDGLSLEGKIKVRLRLPNLENRFHLILSSEEEDSSDTSFGEDPKSKEATLILQYTQKRNPKFSFTHRLNLDIDGDLAPSIRSQLQYAQPVIDRSILFFSQALLWEKDEGIGEETKIDLDILVEKRNLLRLSAAGLWSEKSAGYEWRVIPRWLYSFSERRALTVGGYVSGETRPTNQISEYDLFIIYRQRLFKKWFFAELKPEVRWNDEDDFATTGIFTLTFEIQFED